MDDLKTDKSSRKIVRVAEQAVKDDKDVLGNGVCEMKQVPCAWESGKELKCGKGLWRK